MTGVVLLLVCGAELGIAVVAEVDETQWRQG